MTAHTGSQVLLFVCHRPDPVFARRFERLRHAFRKHGDAVFLFDATRQAPPPPVRALPHHVFSMSSLREMDITWMHDSLLPGHFNYPALEYFLKHPDHDYYTVMEYDVHFNGPWSLFFRSLARCSADFVTTHLATAEEQPEWYFWNTLRLPDGNPPRERMIRMMGPLYRISNRAMRHLVSRYAAGVVGHGEVVMPTLLDLAGFTLRDLAQGRRFSPADGMWSWYTYRRDDPAGTLDGSSFRFRPDFRVPGIRPMTLYHPVKEPGRVFATILGKALRRIGRP